MKIIKQILPWMIVTLMVACGKPSVEESNPPIFHIVSTGQSNSIGGGGEEALSLVPFRDNLKMTPDNSGWEPLIEPVTGVENRGHTETHAAEMSKTITEGLGWTIVASNSGEGGRNIRWIEKDGHNQFGRGKAYAHSIEAVRNSTRLAKEMGRRLVVPAVVLIHGEADSVEGTKDYAERLLKMYSDYDADIRAITNQGEHIRMFVTLTGFDVDPISNRDRIHNAIKYAASVNPNIIIAGSDQYAEWQEEVHAHHTNVGYQQIGQMIGESIVEYFKKEAK